jgi:Na+-translocating ferredoxin:NAD+ oxidoreductase subunit B
MENKVYQKLADVLDTLPNGFPATPSGVEIQLLKKVFTEDQADLFCDLRLSFETTEAIAKRTGRPLEGLEEKLKEMGVDGQIFAINLGGTWIFRMLPWLFGIYEFQLPRLDKEFAQLCEEYHPVFNRHFFSKKPQLMQVLPIQEKIAVQQEALSYEKVSSLIDRNASFKVMDCICKKEQSLLGKPCDRPLRVCLAIAPIPGIFEDSATGQVINKEEAYALLKSTEEAGLVHLTANTQDDNIYICNCCGCCCGVLRSINELGIPASEVINSHFYAVIDAENCTQCGMCAEQRCQVKAIEETEDRYRVIGKRCIGCGLCVTTCPTGAIRLVHKAQADLVAPPKDERAWYEERARARGVDFSRYK